jgi:hypothetical protein
LPDVTGRDNYIIAKALAYAIQAIDDLPTHWQEKGDQDDMKRLLEHMIASDDQLAEVQENARNHLTQGKASRA